TGPRAGGRRADPRPGAPAGAADGRPPAAAAAQTASAARALRARPASGAAVPRRADGAGSLVRARRVVDGPARDADLPAHRAAVRAPRAPPLRDLGAHARRPRRAVRRRPGA